MLSSPSPLVKVEREKPVPFSPALRVFYHFLMSLNLLYHIYLFEATSVQVTSQPCILEKNVYNIVGNTNVKESVLNPEKGLPINPHLCFLELLFAF
jgi:hypothetical protein